MQSLVKKVLGLSLLIWSFCWLWTNAYLLGFKSFDNTVDNIVQIEQKYGIYLPIVSFIYDPREQNNVPEKLKEIKEKLWSQRVYHLSISPNSYTAQEVANWAFDSQYLTFFHLIKELNLKVIFRTMHEMNGGRYPRSSNPESFKKAWIHVWELSRQAGLDKSHILFDFSANARDLPAKNWRPSQTATFIHCEPALKGKLKCPSLKDYYPGDNYVDLVGFTFYNRGKGNSNRRRGSPDKIVNNPTWNTLQRLKKFWKPIFVDEVATTAVDYPESYDYQRSLNTYQSRSDLKDARILQLRDFLQRETQIVGAIYFNVDLTNGLQYKIIGELDRALINLSNGKFYQSFWELYSASNLKLTWVLDLFWLKTFTINQKTYYLSPDLINKMQEIEQMISKNYPTATDKYLFYKDLITKPASSPLFGEAVKKLYEAYTPIEKKEKNSD